MKDARKMFERSIQAEPNYRAYSNLSIVYYMEERYAEAAAMCEKALELNDTSYKTWAALGNAYHWVPGKGELSRDAYRRAVELAEDQRRLKPNDPWLITSLAGYYAVLGENDRALALIERALEIDAENPRIAYFAGHAYEQMRDRDRAVEWIGRALENGYSKSDAQSDPFLKELRRDRRFQEMLEGTGRPDSSAAHDARGGRPR
jgi:tetratricopeptide (TPR) repeat protein